MFNKILFLLSFYFFCSSVFAQDLFFSEYIEGSGNNKALEIYNPTESVVSLANYQIFQTANGSDTTVWEFFHIFPAEASIAPGDVWVITTDEADATLQAVADEVLAFPSVVHFNGDDARALATVIDTDTTLLDLIGVTGPDPGNGWAVAGVTDATQEHTLIRKSAVTSGTTDWAAAAGSNVSDGQWRVLPQNYGFNLGEHTVGEQYQTYTIYELQWVPDPATSAASRFLGTGDTIVVQGKIMHGHNDLWIGARWSTFIVDPNTFPDPWSGFFIVQNDTFAVGTTFNFIEPGMIVNFTGVMATFGGLTQLNLITNPVIPIEIVSTGNPVPDPIILTAADLNDAANGEQWEGMFATLENVEMINPQVGGDIGSITDASGGTTYISEYFQYYDDQFSNGVNPWPSSGTRFTLTGFIREESGTPGQVYSVNPRNDDDIVILTNPPQISGVMRNPGVPASSDMVTVSATITDEEPGVVQSATLHYSVNEGAFMEVSMTADGSTYSADIPAQADGAYVRYFLSAEDNDADNVAEPADTTRTSGGIYSYTVRDGGLTIADVQNTHGYSVDRSPYSGYEVTLTGIVMIDSSDTFSDLYLQDAAAEWSGIWVNDVPQEYDLGDEVSVTGMIEENFGVTRMDDVTNISLVNAAVGAFEPMALSTGDFGEAHESILVEFTNAEVSVEFPDGYPGFGEFTINDGSGNLRVDDLIAGFAGQGADTTYPLGHVFETIRGIGYYSFSNFKILPRNLEDVGVIEVGIENDDFKPMSFKLGHNFPNPFNPATSIHYQIAKSAKVKLAVYDIMGREIAVLVNRNETPGVYEVIFDASDLSTGVYFYRLEAGSFVKTHKMLLIK